MGGGRGEGVRRAELRDMSGMFAFLILCFIFSFSCFHTCI